MARYKNKIMIEPIDLRIGNILQRDGVIFSAGHIQCNFYGGLVNHEGFIGVEAVPLSEFYLLKFGFENDTFFDDNSPVWFLKKPGMETFYLEWGSLQPTDAGFPIAQYEIKYVHQLQNIFYCITGKELEVKGE